MEKLYKLPKEFGEKWIAALRSGKYPQTTGKLRDDKGYCCLGVGCSLNGIPENELNRRYPLPGWLPEDTLLCVKEKHLRHLEGTLAYMNDNGGNFFRNRRLDREKCRYVLNNFDISKKFSIFGL